MNRISLLNIRAHVSLAAGAVAMAAIMASPAFANPPGIEGEIGIGASVSPRFEGSSEYTVNPWPLVRLDRLTLGNGFQIGGGTDGGFRLGPSFNFRGSRDDADVDGISGLMDVDRAFEFGLGVGYEAEYFALHANLRRGFGGHDGWVGEAGADLVVRPAPDVRLYAGPRISYADGEYMDTYFSVPASATGAPRFDADGGIKSFGAEAGMRYDVNPQWAVEGKATYDRLIGDAADSPIVEAGAANQFGFRLGVVRKFRIDF